MTDYTLYYSPTPNGQKIALMLEELELSYKVVTVNILKGEQMKEEFLKINPNNKIPAIVDHTADDLVVFESGAILEYLSEKEKKFGMQGDLRTRYSVKQWLYWQMAGFGPMLGQLNQFWKYIPTDVPVAKERYLKESIRLFTVLDKQLANHPFIAGDEYSIADMACYFWALSPLQLGDVKHHFEKFPNVNNWTQRISEHPAVAKVHAIPFEL